MLVAQESEGDRFQLLATKMQSKEMIFQMVIAFGIVERWQLRDFFFYSQGFYTNYFS